MLPESAGGPGVTGEAGGRPRAATPPPPAADALAAASATAVPAQTGPASAASRAVQKVGIAAARAGAAPRASGIRAFLSPRLLSFIAIVVVPTALAASYLFAAAS